MLYSELTTTVWVDEGEKRQQGRLLAPSRPEQGLSVARSSEKRLTDITCIVALDRQFYPAAAVHAPACPVDRRLDDVGLDSRQPADDGLEHDSSSTSVAGRAVAPVGSG